MRALRICVFDILASSFASASSLARTLAIASVTWRSLFICTATSSASIWVIWFFRSVTSNSASRSPSLTLSLRRA